LTVDKVQVALKPMEKRGEF